MEQVRVTVPRGIAGLDKSLWVRRVLLRRLVGDDERLLAELSGEPLHTRALALLERVTSFCEGEEGNTANLLRRLSIGDRVALLLQLRRMELGDNLDCTVSCAKCGKTLSVILSVTSLLNIRHPAPSESYEVDVGGYCLQVRPLTALDQDMVTVSNANEGRGEAAGNENEEERLEEMMARRCIVRFDQPLPKKLPEFMIQAIGSRLEQVDPLSDITLNLSCAECGHEFCASFNAEDFISKELGTDQVELESEVHWLASHYHWSEREILSLPVRRRRRYISLINATSTSSVAGGVA